MAHYYFGIAGWSYPDWEGVVYPRGLRKTDQLPYIAGYFDVVELNNTFYRIPESKMVENWVKRVEQNPDFRFTAKLWQGFTHEKREIDSQEVKKIREAFRPLVEDHRLGSLLIQFPISFQNNTENRSRVAQLQELFGDMHP